MEPAERKPIGKRLLGQISKGLREEDQDELPQATSTRPVAETSGDQSAPVTADDPTKGSGDLVGQTLGRFQLQELLGQGGVGQVYRAWDPTAERIVALKVLRAHSLATPLTRERFGREARATAQLRHPNVVTLYEVGLERGIDYLVFEYIPGGSLADLLGREGPLPPRRAALIALDVSQGLACAHAAGILHRDVKPGNVLMHEDDTASLTDFGLARSDAEEQRITRTGQVCGTPAYMPPEQALGLQRQLDPRSDVYALGATLHELLTGTPPELTRAGATFKVTLSQAQSWDPQLAKICRRCLEPAPERRYPSAQAVAHDLTLYLRGEPLPGQRRPGLAAALVLASLTAGVALFFSWNAAAPATTPTLAPAEAPPAPTPTPVAGYFVSPQGKDSDSGSRAKPFRTIARGVRELKPGETLYLAGGTYGVLDSSRTLIPSGTSWTNTVAIKALEGERPVLKAPPGSWSVIGLSPPLEYLELEGLTIDATGATIGVLLSAGTRFVRLRDLKIMNASNAGVVLDQDEQRGAEFNQLLGLHIHDTGTQRYQGSAISVRSSHNLIEGCEIAHNAGYGISVYHTKPGQFAHDNLLRGNRIFSNATTGSGGGILLASGRANRAINNLSWGNQFGIHLAYGARESVVYHNTVAHNFGWGFKIEDSATGTLLVNNLSAHNGTDYVDKGVDTEASHNLTGEDPRFANVAQRDYSLSPESPARGAGKVLPEVATDIDGNRRSTPPALGAFER